MEREPESTAKARERYINLLKRSLLGQTYFDNELRILYLRQCVAGISTYDETILYEIRRLPPEMVDRYANLLDAGFPIGTDLNQVPFSSTMVGSKRLNNVEHCVRTILEERIPGDLAECGVWRGGCAVFLRGLLAAYEVTDRRVWVADSFQGLPRPELPPDVELGMDLSRDRYPALAVDLETVRRTFESHGLLDEQVCFVSGWFEDTLRSSSIDRLALLRIDGDLYSSTKTVLDTLYDRVAPGGYVIVDDYFLPNCRRAVDEFIVKRGLTEVIERIDWTGIYWRIDEQR